MSDAADAAVWRLRVLQFRWSPFRSVSEGFGQAMLLTTCPGLVAAVVCPRQGVPCWKAVAAVAAAAAYACGYSAVLGIGIRPDDGAPGRAWTAMFVGQLVAAVAGGASRGRRVTGVVLAAASLWCMLCTVSQGAVRLADPTPRPYYEVMRSMEYWTRYAHPTPPYLLCGLLLTAAAAMFGTPGAFGFSVSLWFFETRLWWTSCRSKVLPLDEHAAAVIHAQAALQGMSVQQYSETYIGMMAESPLVVRGDGSLFWKGCHVDSVPCFVHNYVDMLGINTPPCCSRHMCEMAAAAAAILSDASYQSWIDGGTLLGATRHSNNVLPWEDDVDLGYFTTPEAPMVLPDTPLAARLAAAFAEKGYTFTVSQQGNMHVFHSRTPAGMLRHEIFRRTPYRSLHLDIVPFRRTEDGRVSRLTLHKLPDGRYTERRKVWDAAALFPLGRTTLGGHPVPCPCDPDAYLTVLYGDWREVSYQYITHNPIRRARMEVDTYYLKNTVNGFMKAGWGGLEETKESRKP